MHDERQRQVRTARMPRRPTDHIEDLVAWALSTLALLTVVLAATVAVRLYGEGMHRVDVETRERTQVHAVLLEPARYALATDERGQGVRPQPVPVPVRHTAPDGTEHRAEADAVAGLPGGAAVPIWLDRSGAVTCEPATGLDAVGSAVTGAGGVLALGAAVLGGIWIGVRQVVLRLDIARWDREWERVEPRWSGRTP